MSRRVLAGMDISSVLLLIVVLVALALIVVFVSRAGRRAVPPPHSGDEGGPTGEPYLPGSRPAGPEAEPMVADPSPRERSEPMDPDPSLVDPADED